MAERLLSRLAVAMPAVGAIALLLSAVAATRAQDLVSEFEAACKSDNPYVVTVCYPVYGPGELPQRDAPTVVVFKDTPGNLPHYVLATEQETGSLWGLAYSEPHGAVWASAFHKRSLPFGPGGPGAIYRVDLATLHVTQAITVPNAGSDRHSPDLRNDDRDGGPWAGKTSLGDIDLNESGTELFVANLSDRRIYRFAVPSGQLLGSFAHGASGQLWTDQARPFGLKAYDGRVYHGVVHSAETSQQQDELLAHVYSSLPDGSDMRLEAAFSLDYTRGFVVVGPLYEATRRLRVDWRPWLDSINRLPTTRNQMMPLYPQPMLSDIEFDTAGDMVIGLKDRSPDVTPHRRGDTFDRSLGRERPALAIGDILRGAREGVGFNVVVDPEHYDDKLRINDESALGALAHLPATDVVVASSLGELELWWFWPRPYQGAIWYDEPSGTKQRKELVCSAHAPAPREPLASPQDNEGSMPGSLGDLEALCGVPTAVTATPADTALPTQTATSTITPAVTPTASIAATKTSTATSTPTATAVPLPLFLPLLLRERCNPEYRRSDIALVIDTSSSMTGQKIADARNAALAFVGLIDLGPGRSQVAVVRYDREAEVVRELTRARATLDAVIRGLRVRSGTHIDKGLRAALEELQSPRHFERNTQVLVLLTDGVQTGAPGEELKAAAEVREAGVRVYAIGLGGDADTSTLLQIAGTDERYYFAPDSGDLARIYGEIAVDLMCPGMWGGR